MIIFSLDTLNIEKQERVCSLRIKDRIGVCSYFGSFIFFCFESFSLAIQARSEDFKRGGGEISNVVVFKKILKN